MSKLEITLATVHDHGSNLTGNQKGLIIHLQDEFNGRYLFDLNDPCHAIHLAVEKSLEVLPQDTMKFINKIHAHFRSPQRISFLSKIQQNENLAQLSICHYVETRWLSLGLSLNRLIQIWPSLKLYMEKTNPPKIKKKDREFLVDNLTDQVFQLKILFLSLILKKTNAINVIFQTQALEVHKLRNLTYSCLKEIAELFLNEMAIPDDISKFKTISWEENSCLLAETAFIESLKIDLSPKFSQILEKPLEIRSEFVEFCQSFLKSLLKWLIYYLPIDNAIVDALNFVSLPLNTQQMKRKIVIFNQEFKIFSEDLEDDLKLEVNELMKLNIDWARQIAQDSALRLWDLIESTYNNEDSQKAIIKKFPLLSKIFHHAHLFCQEYKEKTKIIVTERLIELFDGLKKLPNNGQIEEQKSCLEIQPENSEVERNAQNVDEADKSTDFKKKIKLNDSLLPKQESIHIILNDQESEYSTNSEVEDAF